MAERIAPLPAGTGPDRTVAASEVLPLVHGGVRAWSATLRASGDGQRRKESLLLGCARYRRDLCPGEELWSVARQLLRPEMTKPEARALEAEAHRL